MTEPSWLEVYRRPAAPLIKAAIIAWHYKDGGYLGTHVDLLAAFLNDLLECHGVTAERLYEVQSLLDQMTDIDDGNYEFDSYPKTPERAIEESDARDDLDDMINTLIGNML